MVNSCAAAGCTSRVMKNDNRAFHKFPINNSEFCKKWIVAMKRETFIPTEHSRICSDHFLPSDTTESIDCQVNINSSFNIIKSSNKIINDDTIISKSTLSTNASPTKAKLKAKIKILKLKLRRKEKKTH
ncbi:THAP domain-containing protein 1-like [Hydra vulgaris]|uniref:THAP domain-containing protein 1-like n=1 Tax=Hydra vulgaris TaxID=6087 RepID=UPI0032EA0801